jgi:hypothetical protein
MAADKPRPLLQNSLLNAQFSFDALVLPQIDRMQNTNKIVFNKHLISKGQF